MKLAIETAAGLILTLMVLVAIVSPPWAEAPVAAPRQLGLPKIEASSYPEGVYTAAAYAGDASRAGAIRLVQADESQPRLARELPGEDLEIILVIDTSLSASALRSAQSAAVEFVLQLPPGSRVAVLGSSGPRSTVGGMTTDAAAMIAAIGALKQSHLAATLDTLVFALDQFSDRAGAFRAMVALSGGRDQAITARLDTVAKLISSSDTVIHGIELEGERSGQNLLQDLSRRVPGGQAMLVASPSELVRAYDQVAEQLLAQYRRVSEARGRDTPGAPRRVASGGIADHPAAQGGAPASRVLLIGLITGMLVTTLMILVTEKRLVGPANNWIQAFVKASTGWQRAVRPGVSWQLLLALMIGLVVGAAVGWLFTARPRSIPATSTAAEDELSPAVVAGHDMRDGEPMSDHNGVDHAGQGSVDESVAGAPDITLNAVDFDFQPETIELTAGKSVNVTVVNAGEVLHDFTLEEAGVHVNVPPGGQVTTSLVVDEPGAYEALCTVPGHAAAGMVVKVVVGK